MRLLLLFALFSGLGVAAPPHEVMAPFILYTDFQVKPPDSVHAAIEQELESLIRLTGWQIVWKRLQEAGETVSVTLAVVHFKGACDLTDMTQYYPSVRLVFGSTHLTDGKIIPFADIYCGAIRAFLAGALEDVTVRQREWLFGRAVGRVLAHELYHILGNEKTHGARGIAESGFTQQQLLAEGFRFSPKEVRKLRIRLVPVALQSYERQSNQEPGVPASFVAAGCSGCHGMVGEGTAWGPALRGAGSHVGESELVARLGNPGLPMYRRAQELKLLWPRLRPDEIGQLAAFLQRLNN